MEIAPLNRKLLIELLLSELLALIGCSLAAQFDRLPMLLWSTWAFPLYTLASGIQEKRAPWSKVALQWATALFIGATVLASIWLSEGGWQRGWSTFAGVPLWYWWMVIGSFAVQQWRRRLKERMW